ncbi:DUF4190 domain-containing protein [Streptomyces sp. NPDC058812]|uniref:DUF4190 domain-containing protein n=1 Tax=unclassified Streptomyces TaxID=2593676 RepID=UPI0036BC3C75
MPDDSQPPRADAHTPEAPGNDPAPRPAPPGAAGAAGAAGDTWSATAGGHSEGIADAIPGVGLDKPGTPGTPSGSGTTDALAAPGASGTPDRRAQPSPSPSRPGPGFEDRPSAIPGPGPDPWAPPVDDAVPTPDGGSGGTLAASGAPPWSAPSVHDQQTVTSMPAMDTPPWAAPSAATPANGPANPFAPPGPTAAATGAPNPFAPPGPAAATGAPNPFAPPAATPPYVDRGAVPPPPIAPDGPGQVPYGYPGPGGYGHPGGPAGYPGAQPQGYFGWPGMAPLPSNGMGTAGLVLGIIAAVGFCLWPLAIALGVLAVIFGGLGRAKAGRGEATNGGQALAGIICGIVGIALGIGFGLLVIFAP